MLLNLKQLGAGASYGDKSLVFTHNVDLSAVKLWGEHPFLKPVYISGKVDCCSGIFTIRYTADFEASGRCSRCLVPVVRKETREFEHTILIDAEDADISGDFIPAPGSELDLDELAASDILLDYGEVILCGGACKGICPKCGKNLNEGDCGCDLRETDLRFDVLRKLLDE